MFISQREADERLRDDRNLFRDPEAVVRPVEIINPEIIEPEPARSPNSPHKDMRDADDSDLSLSNLDRLLSPRLHRSKPYTNIDDQAAIAETAILIGPRQTGYIFDRSAGQEEKMSRGFTSGQAVFDHAPKPELVSRISQIKERLAEKAADKLDSTLNALTPSKIGEIKRATNLSKVAKDMAVILDKCTEHKDQDRAGAVFHIFRPEIVQENYYTTVQVGPSLPSGSAESRSSNK